jgi:hypothetical protein
MLFLIARRKGNEAAEKLAPRVSARQKKAG